MALSIVGLSSTRRQRFAPSIGASGALVRIYCRASSALPPRDARDRAVWRWARHATGPPIEVNHAAPPLESPISAIPGLVFLRRLSRSRTAAPPSPPRARYQTLGRAGLSVFVPCVRLATTALRRNHTSRAGRSPIIRAHLPPTSDCPRPDPRPVETLRAAISECARCSRSRAQPSSAISDARQASRNHLIDEHFTLDFAHLVPIAPSKISRRSCSFRAPRLARQQKTTVCQHFFLVG